MPYRPLSSWSTVELAEELLDLAEEARRSSTFRIADATAADQRAIRAELERRQRLDDDQRRELERDEQRDYAEERSNAIAAGNARLAELHGPDAA